MHWYSTPNLLEYCKYSIAACNAACVLRGSVSLSLVFFFVVVMFASPLLATLFVIVAAFSLGSTGTCGRTHHAVKRRRIVVLLGTKEGSHNRKICRSSLGGGG